MFRTMALLGASLAAGWFSFSVVSGIDMGDVVAYNNFQKHVGSEPLRAGDVVAFAPATTQPRLLCSMDVKNGVLRESPIAKTYVNGMADVLPQFVSLVDWFAGKLGFSNGDQDVLVHPSTLVFVGRVSRFPEGGETPPMSRDCACAIAKSLSVFEQVCTIDRSLIETRLVPTGAGSTMISQDSTVGVTVRDGNFFFPDLASLGCQGMLNAATSPIPREPGLCGQGMERSFDVALRQRFRVIREENLDRQP